MTDRTNERWTGEEKTRCAEMLRRGESIAQISNALNRSIGAIESQARSAGIVRPGARQAGRKWTEAEDAEVERLWRQGTPDAGIARAIGRSPSSVEMRRARLDLVRLRPGNPGAPVAPAGADLAERTAPVFTPTRVDLYALWAAANATVRERQSTDPSVGASLLATPTNPQPTQDGQ